MPLTDTAIRPAKATEGRTIKLSDSRKTLGNDDPLFPATKVGVGPDRHFTTLDLVREHWSTTTAIRQIFKKAFESAGMPYANPYSFRNKLLQLALCPQAWTGAVQGLGPKPGA
jgi:hypothetical protein